MKEFKEFTGKLTTKGQITLPVSIRRLLGVSPHDQIVFRVFEGRVEIKAAPMSLEDTFGAVKPLKTLEDFKEIRDWAIEERVQKVIGKLQE